MTSESSPTIFDAFSPASVRSSPFNYHLRNTLCQQTPPISPLCKHNSFECNQSASSSQLVERCVVVAKHHDGYGLTVNGEHPVFVETVKPNGAAAQAGVREGDQIVKINGMPVSSSNHYEVLRMISAGPNVALTLFGVPVSCQSCRPQFFDITQPRKSKKWITKHESGSLKTEDTGEASRKSSFNSFDQTVEQVRQFEASQRVLQGIGSEEQLDSGKVEPVRQWVNSGGRHYTPGSVRDLTPELSHEEEDASAMQEPSAVTLNPFGSAQDLRRNPDELALFVNYSVHHADPSSSLFYLITDAYQACNVTLKEQRRFAYEIFSTFLIPGAPLIVPGITQLQIQPIDRILTSYNNNQHQDQEQIKKVFISCRSRALSAMEDIWGEYKKSNITRAKCDPGSSLNAKMKFAEQILFGLLEELSQVCGNDFEKCDSRGLALLMSIATIIKIVLNIKPSQLPWEKLLDKCPTFVTTVTKAGVFRMKPIMNKRSMQVLDHQFNMQSVFLTVHCYQCRDAVWGVNPHAYFCQNCDVIVHKQCTSSLADRCYPVSQKTKTQPGSSTLRHPRPRTVSALNLSSTTSTLNQIASSAPVYQRSGRPTDTKSMGYDPSANSSAKFAPMDPSDLPPNNPPPAIPSQPRLPSHAVTNAKSTSSDSGIGADVDNRPVSRSQSIKTRERMNPQLEEVSEQPAMESDAEAALTAKSSELRSVSGSSAISVVEGLLDIAENDSDLEVDVDIPPLEQFISYQVLKRMDPKQRKLQESINEFMHTERSHVRNLKVIYRVFNKPIVEQKLVSKEFLKMVFANLNELIEIHSSMYQKMKIVKEQWKKDPQFDGMYAKLGATIASFFTEENGEQFKKSASIFCRNQQYGLRLLGERRAKDDALSAFLSRAEANPLCRKFQLKDLLPVEMQRLVKYPLLLDTILRYTPEASEEFQQYTLASIGAKKLLSAVNTAKRDAENRRYLEEINKKIEMPTTNRPYDDVIRRFDIMQYRYIYDGDVIWRHSRGKSDMHLVLLDYLLLILTKGNDNKYYMRSQDTNAVPLLWLPSVTVEEKAGDKRAFVIFYERDLRTYELQAQSVTEKKTWEQLLKSQIAAAKNDLPQDFEADIMSMMPKLKSSQPSTDVPSPSAATEVAEEVQVTMHAGLVKASEIIVQKPQVMVMEEAKAAKVLVQPARPAKLNTSEKLQRADHQLAQALIEKNTILATDLMNESKLTKEDLEAIAETLTGMSTVALRNRKPAEIALSAIVHGNRLIDCINTRMNNRRHDSDKVSEDAERHLPFVPCYKLTAVAAPLMNHLTTLSQVIKEQREEIDSLKRELQRNRIEIEPGKDRSVSEETLTEPSSNIVLRSPSKVEKYP